MTNPPARPLTTSADTTYTHPIPTAPRRPAEGDDVAGAEVCELICVSLPLSLASTVTTTTEGVAVVVALPLLLLDVEGVEDVGEGVLLDEYPAGRVETLGIVVDPVADEAAPGKAANPTAGGLYR